MLLNRWSCIYAVQGNRPMLYMCNVFIKCMPLKASEVMFAVKLLPHQGTLKLCSAYQWLLLIHYAAHSSGGGRAGGGSDVVYNFSD